MAEETQLGEILIEVCRKMEKKGFIAATDGNVSCRVDQSHLLITPSGRNKGELEPSDLLLVDLHGEVLVGEGKPSSEIRMHLLVYEKRADVQAIVHAHPPLLTAFTLAGFPFVAEALPEVWLTIGAVPTAPYATPSTEEVPESIVPFIEHHQAILLERHGSLTLGKSLKEAYMRLEKLEHAAYTFFYAYLLNHRHPMPLPESALKKLKDVFAGKDSI
jgi:L-fuculose-phosphate aldolase